MVIPVFIAFVVLLLIGVNGFVEDYKTSKMGYAQVPTQKTSQSVIAWMALLPQIITVTIGYIAVDRNSKWAWVVVVSATVWDLYTDVTFKAAVSGQYIIATAESLLLYTLGSEIAITVAAGMLIELFPKFAEQVVLAAKRIGEVMDNAMGVDEDPIDRGGYDKQQRR